MSFKLSLPSVPKLKMPVPYKKRKLTIHGLLTQKVGKMSAAGAFKKLPKG